MTTLEVYLVGDARIVGDTPDERPMVVLTGEPGDLAGPAALLHRRVAVVRADVTATCCAERARQATFPDGWRIEPAVVLPPPYLAPTAGWRLTYPGGRSTAIAHCPWCGARFDPPVVFA